MKSKYWQGAIFDLDGTLADTLPVSFSAFRRTIRELTGQTWSNAEIRARFGPSEEGVLRRLLERDAGEAYALFLRLYQREHRRCPAPFAGMPELLGELKGTGVRLAIVTGKGADAAAITLEQIGLGGAFEAIEAGSAEKAIKSDCMRRVLSSWRIPVERIFSLGDFPYDVRAAREVGVTPVGAAWASTADRESLVQAGAEEVFDRVAELAAWLRQGC